MKWGYKGALDNLCRMFSAYHSSLAWPASRWHQGTARRTNSRAVLQRASRVAARIIDHAIVSLLLLYVRLFSLVCLFRCFLSTTLLLTLTHTHTQKQTTRAHTRTRAHAHTHVCARAHRTYPPPAGYTRDPRICCFFLRYVSLLCYCYHMFIVFVSYVVLI